MESKSALKSGFDLKSIFRRKKREKGSQREAKGSQNGYEMESKFLPRGVWSGLVAFSKNAVSCKPNCCFLCRATPADKQNGRKMVSETSQDPKAILRAILEAKRKQKESKMEPKWNQNGARIGQELNEKLMSNFDAIFFEFRWILEPKRSQNGARICQKLSEKLMSNFDVI